jgi:hypothetical protein
MGAGKKRQMPLMRRANEVDTSEWRPIPLGVWRFRVNPAPEIKFYEQWNSHRARFPLLLTTDEQTRLFEEHGKPPEETQQSTRASYLSGLSLGYPDRATGQYKSTKLVDFLAACLGQQNQKRFYDWIANGGGPPKIPDPDDQQAELEAIGQWLGWFEDLEVLGSIRHEEDAKGTIWARFGGPMAIGSLPGQKEDEYQAIGRGKLRSMIAEYEASLGASKSSTARVADDRRPNGGAARERAPMARGVAEAGDRVSSRRRSYEDNFPEDKDEIPF